jgi:hypothetical protein
LMTIPIAHRSANSVAQTPGVSISGFILEKAWGTIIARLICRSEFFHSEHWLERVIPGCLL